VKYNGHVPEPAVFGVPLQQQLLVLNGKAFLAAFLVAFRQTFVLGGDFVLVHGGAPLVYEKRSNRLIYQRFGLFDK
jgi:hypothetical protein